MKINGTWIVDVEADGLEPTKIHVLSCSNIDGTIKKSTGNYDDMRKFLLKANVIIGHNFYRWDSVHLERLLGIKISAKIVDTLALSWVLFPYYEDDHSDEDKRGKPRNRHGLEEWGEEFGYPKPKIDDWYNLSYEEYEHRCKSDVEINRLLWKKCYDLLVSLYGSNDKIWEYLDYLSFKMYCARLQEQSGWLVDLDRAKASLKKMLEERSSRVEELKAVMPMVPVFRYKEKPKVFFKKDGTYSKHAMEWNALLADYSLPGNYEGEIKIWMRDEEPNPASVPQIKDWLYSLGWKPETFKTVKNKDTGETRQVPQISIDVTKELCPSIIKLIEEEPKLKALEGLTTISSRIACLQGIVNSVDENGYTMAQVQGLTNTLRFQHATIVNLPKVNRPWAEDIRGSLIAPDGYVLCGSDMASLEDRIKQHFIYEYDPEYVDSMNQPDFDPHLTVAGLAGMLTEDQIQKYKEGDKTSKPVRDIAKNGNYACQYGAGVPRLMLTCGISREAATRLFNAYWELNWAVKKVASVQVVKTIGNQMWLKNPINGFYYSLRYMKDVFSTLVQGTASYVFDMWLKFILDKRPQLTGQFHDEIILCIREGFEEQCRELVTHAIDKLNETVKLNRVLGIDIQFDKSYGKIH